MGKGTENLFEKKRLASLLVSGDSPNFALIIKNGTQLSVLKRERGVDVVVGILSLIIAEFCSSFNIKHNMSAEQIADLALELVGEYWAYKLEDFVAFFNLAKKGRYGKIYDRIDAPTIFQMLVEYNIDREKSLYEINIKPTQDEKYNRPKPINELGNLTTLAGAMSSVREMAGKNKEQIERLKPNEGQ